MADIDGKNICALLERLFLMYFPQLIEAGMVYKAVPPLYSVTEGKKERYFTEQIDIVKYVQKDFLKKHSMKSDKKKDIDQREITKFLVRNSDYTYYINKVSNTYAVEPYLLEIVLYNYITNGNKIDEKKLSKSIEKAYRFMKVENNNGITVVKGTIAASNLIICNDKFFFDCRDIINIINKNDELYYYIDNSLHSIYQVMSLYETSIPSNVQRYKGLGEMNADSLAASTLYPGGDRMLIRYTMDDVKDTIKTIREYESNSKMILKEVKRVTRDDLLD